MAVLSDVDRRELWAELMRAAEAYGASFSISKADLRAAFDGVDNGMETSAATINNWFPQPARSNLPVRAKAFIVGLVAMRRALRS